MFNPKFDNVCCKCPLLLSNGTNKPKMEGKSLMHLIFFGEIENKFSDVYRHTHSAMFTMTSVLFQKC